LRKARTVSAGRTRCSQLRGDDPIACKDHVRARLGLSAFKPNGCAPGTRTTIFEFRDSLTGAARYCKKRIEHADGTETFAIEPRGRGGSEPLLYGAERLADASEGQPIWICEGEKKVDRLRELGAIAVSADAGSKSKWLPSHANLLRGLDVILWPDSDEAGETYIANAAACLKDTAASLRVVRPFGPPNGAKGRDVCDWDGDAEALAKLIESAEPYVPLPVSEGSGLTKRKHFEIIPFEDITVDKVTSYLVREFIPRQGLVIVWGPPKCGKSFWAFDMLVHVALGWDYRGRRVKQGAVIYCAPEGAHGFKARKEAFRQTHLRDRAELIPFYLVPTKIALVRDHEALIASIRISSRALSRRQLRSTH
jgi:hypothetical protein